MSAVNTATSPAPPAPKTGLRAWLRLFRPHHWNKNLLVLAAPFFGGALLEREIWSNLSLALGCFILLSSAVYAFNDALDAPSDRHHPRKRLRPVASGAISAFAAVILAIILAGLSLGLAAWLGTESLVHTLFWYALLNLLYSGSLKHWPVVDLLIVSSGFVLRVCAGGFAVGIEPSLWLLGCTALSTFFLAACKRRSELFNAKIEQPQGVLHRRPVLDAYPVWLLECLSWGSGLLAVIAFGWYALSVHEPWVAAVATPLAMVGVWRYASLTKPNTKPKRDQLSQQGQSQAQVEALGETPENLFWKDRLLLVVILAWAVVMGASVYGKL